MKRLAMIIVGVFLLAMSSVTMAADGRAYVGGSAGVFIPQNSTVTDIYGASADVSYDAGFLLTGFGGYEFGNGLRVEGELSYRSADVDNYSYWGRNAYPGTTYWARNAYLDNYIGAFSMMGNVYYDIRNQSNVTPYLGGGIGFSVVNFESGVWDNNYSYSYSEDDTVFAYQLGAGVCIDLNKKVALDIGYRYFGTEDIQLPTTKVEFSSHNVIVGAKYRF